MTKFSMILELLSDGQWHSLEEIQEKTKLAENQIRRIVAFLEEYKFVMTDQIRAKARLDKTAREFLGQNATP